jgi:hypothetical protein
MTRYYTILLPVYNDWSAVAKLLPLLNEEVAAAGHRCRLLLVNDGSTEECPTSILNCDALEAVFDATILMLGTNLGHQRAIAVGIAHIAAQDYAGDVVVMDSDGEDLPCDVPRLIRAAESLSSPSLVMADRAKRSETPAFQLAYAVYRWVFQMLTGQDIRFGNFSLIPAHFVPRLARMPEVWNHYAAAIVKARLPRTSIVTSRGRRLDGASQMKFVALVLHGLSAVSVFNEIVGVRLLCIVSSFLAICVMAILGVVTSRCLSNWVIPSWTTAALGMTALLATHLMFFAVSFVLIALSARTTFCVVPARDYLTFVKDVIPIKKQSS